MRAMPVLGILFSLTLCGTSRGESPIRHTRVFVSGQGGYRLYRIPAVETAPDGSVLAFVEARKHHGEDPGMGGNDIDLVMKRSADGGATWSAMKMIENPDEGWDAGNPATLVDRDTGRVWLFYIRIKQGRTASKTLARTSDDSGVTWSEPIDLTAVARDLADSSWNMSVPGPGGAIQNRKGWLIVPMWGGGSPFAIYSEDHGRTWQRGKRVPGIESGAEPQAVELSDGRILMDIRHGGGKRMMAASEDGGKSWLEARVSPLVTPGTGVSCAIETYTSRSAGATHNRILWTGPRTGRKNMVIRVTYDDAISFPVERLFWEGRGGYSDLTIQDDESIGVLWEGGAPRAGAKYCITFTRLTREFLEPAQ